MSEFILNPKCPRCGYDRYKPINRLGIFVCEKCNKVEKKYKVNLREFKSWNISERKRLYIEALDELIQEKFKPVIRLTPEQKRQRSRECQRKIRQENPDKYNQEKREYWESNKTHLNLQRKKNYSNKKPQILSTQKGYRERNPVLRQINNLRYQHKLQAIKLLDSGTFKPFTFELDDTFPTLVTFGSSRKKVILKKHEFHVLYTD